MVDQGPAIGLPREASEEEEAEGIGLEGIKDLVGFALHAARRRPVMSAFIFLTVSALGLAVAAIMPRNYSASVKMLAQSRSKIHMLTSPNPGIDQAESPTTNVAAMITRRDNLLALVREGNVVERNIATRSAALKLKDKILGAPTGDDMQLAMALTLEKRIEVITTEEGTLEIAVSWSDPHMAYDLVTLVQKNFLEARYDSDVAVITESIAVLEDHARAELTHVDAELEDYQKVVAARSPKRTPVLHAAGRPVAMYAYAPKAASSAEPVADRPDPDAARQLEDLRTRIRALEDGQQRAIDGARQQLTQAQLTLTPMHPTVIALQQQLDTVSQPSPELADLRGQERSLMAQMAPPRPVLPAATSSVLPTIRVAPLLRADLDASAGDGAASLAMDTPAERDHDGVLQLAQSKLNLAIGSYEDAVAAVDRAKVELDVTRAAYKHRYTVVTPAELPKSPRKPMAKFVGTASVIGGALLAILLAAAMDFASGLVLESWQVRRRLKLDVLGELDILR
jgi:uncharacterized protein involved in exopolysaccharide biosynthesis